MLELTKPQRAARPDDDDPLSGVAGGGEDEEEAGGIANMRVVNASKVQQHDTQLDPFPAPKDQDRAVYITAGV